MTQFVAPPLRRLYDYRDKARELVILNANVSKEFIQHHREEYERRADEIRRLAAQIDALSVSMPWPILAILRYKPFRIDLAKAAGGLRGCANAFGTTDGSRAIARHDIERGLRLPEEDTDERIERIWERKDRG